MASEAEQTLRSFVFERVLNEDPLTKSINLLGKINGENAIIIAEKLAFDTSESALRNFCGRESLEWVDVLDRNDIYHWFLGGGQTAAGTTSKETLNRIPQQKLTLIFPATETHVRKYGKQDFRMVTETPEIYRDKVVPYIAERWGPESGRVNWVYNILEHKAEKERIVFEEEGEEGFILLPDLKWDRKTMASLYLVAITKRRDITSLRDLCKKHVPWLEGIRRKILDGTVAAFPNIAKNQLKLYFHYHPSYYHLHIHVESISANAGGRQAVGRAILLDNAISQLKTMGGGEDSGFKDLDMTFFIGEETELWQKIYSKLDG